jgi:hypothetical protein
MAYSTEICHTTRVRKYLRWQNWLRKQLNLQSERDALKAEIEALTKKAKGRKKATSEPEESGMVTTKKQQGTDDSGTN